MPEGAVPRALEYVGLLFLLCLASTFAWWAAANVARAEYRRLLSALACSMRIVFYSVCLLAILVAARSLHLAPQDPRSTLFGWIHLAGTVWITVPSAWRWSARSAALGTRPDPICTWRSATTAGSRIRLYTCHRTRRILETGAQSERPFVFHAVCLANLRE